MKKNKILLVTTFMLALVVTACTPSVTTTDSVTDPTVTDPSVTTPTETTPTVSPSVPVIEGKTNEDFEFAKTTYVDDLGETQNLNMNTIYRNEGWAPHLDPLEDQNTLIVPFGFTDASLQAKQTDANIERIRVATLGTKEEVASTSGWQSLATYYETASYGKADFSGTVLPTWVNYGNTSAAFNSAANSGHGIYAAEFIRSWYITEYAKDGHGDLGVDAQPLSHFDGDRDGRIDSIIVVYSAPIVSGTDWWAYVTYTGNQPNYTNPTVGTLCWLSMGFLDEGFNGYDAHTFIHETGHLYGLDDYYDYNNTWKPMGAVDMMDQNLGDHNAFSKFSLGWINPLVVDDNATITLKPMTTSGDAFLLPSPNYNGTAFDEYMMVEFVAPVGLNEEYLTGYSGTSGYTEPGLRITHVDARVYAGNHDVPLTDNPEEGRSMRVSNTYGGRSGLKRDADYWLRDNGTKGYYTLISLMESSILDTNWTNSANYKASNSSLFTKGDVFYLPETNSDWSTFMPSQSNLWNKAKTITGWENSTTQTFTIDETMTCDYAIQVKNIEKDNTGEWVATVSVEVL